MSRKTVLKVTALSLAGLVLAAHLLAKKDETGSARIYLTGGTLITGNGDRVLENSLVIIEGKRILYAGLNKPAGDKTKGRVIDCSGKTILSALSDAHVHLSGTSSYSFLPIADQRKLSQFLYSGVTSILDLGGPGAWVFTLRAREKRGEIQSPRIFAVGPLFTSPGGAGTEYGTSMALTPATEEEAKRAVQQLLPQSPNFLKIIYGKISELPSLKYEVMETIVSAAHKNHLRVITLATSLEQAKDAIRAGTDGLTHMVDDREVDDELLLEMKKKRVFCIPALAVTEAGRLLRNQEFLGWPLASRGIRRETIEDIREKSNLEEYTNRFPHREETFTAAMNNLKRMFDSGIKIVLGTDAGNPAVFFGPSVHRELELYVEAGLSPLQAILAATRNVAEILGMSGELGTIEKGKFADILITEGNPLENIKNIQNIFMVIKNGRILDREKLAEEINPPQNPPVSLDGFPDVFDDFEDGNQTSKWETPWQVLTDREIGGTSTAEIKIVRDGADGSKHALHISGSVTTAVPLVFAGVVTPLGNQEGQCYNISHYTGIKFKARGDGKTYRLVLTTTAVTDLDDFFATFTTAENWQEIVVPFSSLRQFGFGKKVTWTGKNVQTLQFMTFGAPHQRFNLFIDDVQFYTEEESKNPSNNERGN